VKHTYADSNLSQLSTHQISSQVFIISVVVLKKRIVYCAGIHLPILFYSYKLHLTILFYSYKLHPQVDYEICPLELVGPWAGYRNFKIKKQIVYI
jgi:hypothetical protein